MKYDKLAAYLKRHGKEKPLYVRLDEIEHSSHWKERTLYVGTQSSLFHVGLDDRLIDFKPPEANVDYHRVGSEAREYLSNRLLENAGQMVVEERFNIRQIWEKMLAYPVVSALKTSKIIYEDAPYIGSARRFDLEKPGEDGTKSVWIVKDLCDALHTDPVKLGWYKFTLHSQQVVVIQEDMPGLHKTRIVAICTAAHLHEE